MKAEDTPSSRLEKRLSELSQRESAGVALLIARDGKILFQGAGGLADVAAKTPITVETKFRIGSVTKQFTAAAILKLAEEGKLAITDPLAKFFPEIPNAKEITLRHLLTHTSGLHSYTDRPDFMAGVTKAVAPADLIATMKNEPSDFAPGAEYKYCNSGYFLLGEIVAQVSGKSFADYLRETFFEPLGMKNTGIYVNATPPPGAALGYSMTGLKADPAIDWDMSWAGGAGAIYSTVGDLWHWNEALHQGKILQAQSYKAMIMPNPLPPGKDGASYGFGLLVSSLHQLPAISHSGGLNGWSSDLAWLPEQRCTIVALSNALPSIEGYAPGSLLSDLGQAFLAGDIAKLPPPTEMPNPDRSAYPAYAGYYDYGSAIMAVTVEKERIFAKLTGQNKFEIFPREKDGFFWKVTDSQVRFLRDEKGEVTAAQHTQNGYTFRAPRLAKPTVTLTREQLDAYVGQYQYGPLAILTVKRDGDLLLAQLTGQPAAPIFPATEDTFEWKVVVAKVQFVKGEDGKVVKAVHQQNGSTLQAPKIK